MIIIDKKEYQERKEHRIEVINLLNKFLDRPNIDNLRALCNALWAFGIYKDKDWLLKERILKNNKPEQLANLFKKKLLNDKLTLKDRVDNVTIPGFGKSSLTEILYSQNPDKYPIYNKRALDALRKLGIPIKSKIEYSDYIKILEKIVDDLDYVRNENSRTIGEEIPRFEFIDYVLNGIYEGKISIEEINRARFIKRKIDEATLNYAIGSIQGAIKQYFYWIEKGVPEEKAIDRANNYALGVISASGVLSNKDTLEKFEYALSSMSELSKGILSLIKDLKKNIK